MKTLGKKYFYLLAIIILILQGCSSKKSDVLVGKYTPLFSSTPESTISVIGVDNGFKPSKSITLNSWFYNNYRQSNNIPTISFNYQNLTLTSKVKLKRNRFSSTSSLTDTIIVSEAGVIYTSALNNTINAVQDGKVIWHTTLDGDIVGLSYDFGFIYTATNTGNVYAIDALDGSISWTRAMGSTIKTSPLVFETSLYVKDTNNSIAALSVYEGGILWTKTGQKPKIEVKSYSLTSASNQFLAVFGLSNGDILGLRRETGQTIWQQKTDNRAKINELSSIADIKSSPVIDQNRIFVSTYSNKSVYLNAQNGNIIWSNKVGSVTSPLLSKNRIFALERNNVLTSIDRKNGNIVWNLDLKTLVEKPKKTTNWYRPLLVSQGALNAILVANSEGDIFFISPINKSIRSKASVKGGIASNPIIYQNKLILMTTKGELLIYEGNA